MRLNSRRLDYLLIVLVSLLPFLWLSVGWVIMGHDAGTPLDPTMHFLDRLFTWTARYGFGADQTFAMPGFFVHGQEYLLSLLRIPLWLQQAITFSSYFMMIGFAMYFFAREVFPQRAYLPLWAAIFYQVNHFTLQAWFIAERTKFSTYILLPLLLLIVHRIIYKKTNILKQSAIAALLTTIFNGGGFVPLFGSILVAVPTYIGCCLIGSKKRAAIVGRLALFGAITMVIFLFLNAYWLMPYVSYVQNSFAAEVGKSGGLAGVINWTQEISRDTSIHNLFRLQGIQEWYVNPDHPYALVFFSNDLLVAASYLIPVGAIMALIVCKSAERRITATIFLIGLASILFMAGSHAPFGYFYIFLLNKLPGFIAFRTPFYKFAPGLWFSFSILLGLLVSHLLTHKRASQLPHYAWRGAIAILIIAYSFPILGTAFFKYHQYRTTRIQVPDYVTQYGAYTNNKPMQDARTLVLPFRPEDSYVESTSWGYWSLASVHSLLNRNNHVSFNLGNSEAENNLLLNLYALIEAGDTDWVGETKRLGINYLLVRDDVLGTDIKKVPKLIDTKRIKQTLNSSPDVSRLQSFGPWHLYKMRQTTPHVAFATGYHVLHDYSDTQTAYSLNKLPIDVDALDVIFDSQPPELPRLFDTYKKSEIVIPACGKCDLVEMPLINDSRDVAIVPNSPFFIFRKNMEADLNQKARVNVYDHTSLLTSLSIRRLFELQTMYRNHQNVGDVTVAWHMYHDQLSALEDSLKKLINDRSLSRAANRNALLIKVTDSVLMQKEELSNLILTSTNEDEAIIKHEVYLKLHELSQQLKNNTIISTEKDVKQYAVPIESSGTYDIYVENDSFSLEQSINSIAFTIANSTEEVVLDTSARWTRLTSVPLQEKLYRAVLKINAATNLLPENLLSNLDSSQQKIVNEQNQCTPLALGTLKPGQYILSYTASTNTGDTILQTQTKAETSITYVLPYNAKVIEIEMAKTLPVSHKLDIKFEDEYVHHVCNFYSNTKQDVDLSEIVLQKIDIPTLLLVKKNDAFQAPIAASIQNRVSTQTSETFTVAMSQAQLMSYNTHFDKRWSLSFANQNPAHLRGNGYSNVWTIEPTTQKNEAARITFAPQGLADIGRIISAVVALVVILGILIL